MAKVLVFVAFLAVGVVSSLGLDICENQFSGTRLLYPTDCTKYIVCGFGEILSILSCEEGKHFNRLTSQCDEPIIAACDVEVIKSILVDSVECNSCRSVCGCLSESDCKTPAPPSPGSSTPAAPTPSSPAPATPTPGSPTPAVSTPATPAPQTPATPAPGSPTPGSPTPGSPTSGSPTPGSSSPGLPTPAPQNPATPAPNSPTPGSPTPASPTPASPTPATPKPSSPSPASPTPASPTPASPTPASPSPASPTPASPSPASPTPGSPTPVSPTPGTPTPASPSPASPTPASPTPNSPTSSPNSTCSSTLKICAGLRDYSSVYVPNTCHEYAICISGCANIFSCPNNLVYDISTHSCTYPENIHCPYPYEKPSGPLVGPSGTKCENSGRCLNQSDGTLFADDASNGYIICQCECEIARPCPSGLVFNESLQVCDFQQK